MQDPSIGLKEVNGIMADNFEKGIKGRRFIRAYLENGKFHLPNGLHSNGVLSSMAGCNCLIDTKTMENQESRSLNAGDKVGAILLLEEQQTGGKKKNICNQRCKEFRENNSDLQAFGDF